MQVPQAPIDVRLVMGNEQGTQHLLSLDLNLSDDKNNSVQHLHSKGFNQDYTQKCVLFFDLQVEPGKEQEAVQYFSHVEGEGRSPLQIIFSKRPNEYSQFCSFQVTAHQEFVRIKYLFHLQNQQSEIGTFDVLLGLFQANQMNFQTHLHVNLRGDIAHTKNNRVSIKVNYSEIRLTSNSFQIEKFIDTILSINDVQQQLQEISNFPIFMLVKKAKHIQANIKMESFRKMNKYYNEVSQTQNQNQTKSFKYQNKQIFRKKAEFTLCYRSHYLIHSVGQYSGQDVFIRLTKVYAKFLQALTSNSFYNDS